MNRPKNFEEILAKFPGAKQIGDHWIAPCPLPGHKTPAGHITLKDAGDKALISDQGGKHTYQDICKWLGFDSLTYLDNAKSNDRKIEAIYQYTDANGKPFEVVRVNPKGFYQRQPDGNGGYINNLNGIEPTLYHQDRLPHAIQNEVQIIIVEGEKDVDRLWKFGRVSTSNPMGAGKWRDNYSRSLKDADLIIIPDNDQPGREHAIKVAKSCFGIAKRVRILELPKAKDISEWLDCGGNFDTFEALIKNSKDFNPFSNTNKDVYIPHDNRAADSKHYNNVTENITNSQLSKENVTESLRKRIKDYGQDILGRWLSYEDLDKELNIKTDEEKANRRTIISRLRTEGIIEDHFKIAKQFRFIDKTVRLINFKQFNQRTPLDIKFPFGIEKLVKTYKKNIIVVAGSPNAGKTAFALNFVRMNQDKYHINYMTSEMGGEEMAERLSMFDDMELDDWPFTLQERTHNFHDGIFPDDINIIDYMELTKEAYLVAEFLRKIFDKLTEGLAIVLLQKKRDSDMGRGAEYSLEKPRLYLSMDSGKTKIVKAKNWVKPDLNPNGMVIKYKIVGGYKFIITNDWHNPEGGSK